MKIEQFLQILGHIDIKSTKEAIFQQKAHNQRFVVKSLLEPNCKLLPKSAIRENFNLKPETQMKISQSKNRSSINHQYKEIKENLSHFLHLYLIKNWALGPRRECNTKCSSSFKFPSIIKNFPATAGRRLEVEVNGSINVFEKTTIAVNAVEHQQTVNRKNWENSLYGFQKN